MRKMGIAETTLEKLKVVKIVGDNFKNNRLYKQYGLRNDLDK